MDKNKFTSISLQEEMQRSYPEYANEVSWSCLPDARDGQACTEKNTICNVRISLTR